MFCTTKTTPIGTLWVDSKRIDLSPPYQRETGVWSPEKKQLFIDSLLNDYDVPKLYVHDLRQREEPISFAVIDGKQRLSAIFEFMNSDLSLADSFEYFGREKDPPAPGTKFRDFSDNWKEIFKAKTLDVVQVQNADEEDIEDLFSRLNNGEALNAAEKRNALGGNMCALIREVSQHKYFTNKVAFPNKRYSYYEVSAKFLKIAEHIAQGGGRFCDLKKRHLDQLVKKNKNLPRADQESYKSTVYSTLDQSLKIFDDKDPNLKKQSYPQMNFIFIRGILQDYGHAKLITLLKEFFPKFAQERADNNELPEEQREWELAEFGRLAQQGTNDRSSMEWRDEIMRRWFLKWNPEVELKDTNRSFTPEERYVIWLRSDKRCSKCGTELKYEDVEADHIRKWARGGKTLLSNARALCKSCNRSDNPART